jgi:hypothetical protein
LTIGVLAMVAQPEAQPISRSTKDALQDARKRVAQTGQRGKPRIKRLGNPNGAAALRRAGKGNIAAIATRGNADERAMTSRRWLRIFVRAVRRRFKPSLLN